MLAYRNAKEIGLNAEYNKIKQPTIEALMRQNLPVTGRNLELPKDTNILSTTSPQSHSFLDLVSTSNCRLPFKVTLPNGGHQ